MSDLIRLLPDSVANQIAAGEVVQRPASVVKELVENAIDAGATKIRLVLKDAGRTLIQIGDNGMGMSAADAVKCFERHATSKIAKAEDLFNIRTKGFRGEALASIAAVAQVEMRTKRREDELGTKVVIEGSEIKSTEPESCNDGTTFFVRNLFYNIPARRNFLKSDNVEFKHILDEFERVALVHADVHFELSHNGTEVFNLPPGNLRQRVVSIFGKSYNERLVPIEEQTPILHIRGYLIKPEYSKKTRGEQFFFVNDRFIKNNYLHHAVQKCYENLILKDHFPAYFIYLDVPPNTIDINIHPTKTEIKFEDEKTMYAILHSAVRRAIGYHNISPSIDFNTETAIDLPLADPKRPLVQPVIQVDPNYNPFEVEKQKTSSNGSSSKSGYTKKIEPNWEDLYKVTEQVNLNSIEQQQIFEGDIPESERPLMQIRKRYILCPIKSGFWMIDQCRAHERILYERFIVSLAHHTGSTQQQLFPVVIDLPPGDHALLKELQEDLRHLGFDISDMGGQSISINGTPVEAGEANPGQILEEMLEELKNHSSEIRKNRRDTLARSMARTLSIKAGKTLERREMNQLIDELFACEQPYFAPNGKPVIVTFGGEEIDKRFNV
jgi:DNA mismatch repair protein MutL